MEGMMKTWKSTRLRRKRNAWKRKGHTHVRIGIGIWLRQDVIDPYNESFGMAQQTIDGHEQPKGYTYYP